MPPSLALFLWLLLLLMLLRFDPARDSGTSLALWVPLIWMFIIGSRLPSQWFGSHVGVAAQALEEGNPLDRTIFSVLILLAIGILVSRSFNWGSFFTSNFILIAFLSFTLVSVLWSDFPFVSLKRWFRDLGNYLVILVVLADRRPLDAVRALLRRFCYLLIPLSILLIKYFPYLGKQYDAWTGASMFVGATTSKNMLGAVCLISGIYFFWDTLTRWSDRNEWQAKKIIVLNLVFIAMTLWLLNLANSATSRMCLVIGCLVIVVVRSRWSKHHPAFVKLLIPGTFCLYLVLAYGFDINGELASQVGRDPTLTDRTALWKILLNMHTNPLVGTGYESFWLGPRLEWVWQNFQHVNEAHNGYLEVYLNLGGIGLILLVGFLIACYRTICKRLASFCALASLSLALWSVILLYNVTEAAFKGGLLWLVLLLGAIAVPDQVGDCVRDVPAFGAKESFQRFPLETSSQRR